MKAGRWIGSLRPEIGDVIGATQFQADQVIDFIFTWQVMRYLILRVDLVFFTEWDITNRAGVS